MKNKRGFTLIELLAVIVILAIIALIVSPLVLKYIEKTRQEAVKETVNSYIRETETSVVSKMLKDQSINVNNKTCQLSGDTVICGSTRFNISIKGDKLDSFNIEFENEGIIKLAAFKKGKYCGKYVKNSGVSFTECGQESLVDAGDVGYINEANPEVQTVEDALNDLYNR